MSSKLAQFLIQERFPKSNIRLNIPEVRQTVDELIALIYPQRRNSNHFNENELDLVTDKLQHKLESFLEALTPLQAELSGLKKTKVLEFFDKLPKLTKKLDLDAHAAFQGDPAAYSVEEVILSYPGFYAICVHRIAHAFHELGIKLLPRIMSEYAHEKTGIDIHPGAQIDESFFIDHGTGVVIGETALIGKNVKIYQGVTLGALSVKKKLQSIKRHPTIEDDVVIYANSTILGGETIIGKGSVIGGNTWITESLPAGSTYTLSGK